MSIIDAIVPSYRFYLGAVLVYIFLPWLVLVLWQRWLPQWRQTLTVWVLCLLILPPLIAVLEHGPVGLRLVLHVIVFAVPVVVIWILRRLRIADATSPPPTPDARWKHAAAFVGMGLLLSVIVAMTRPGAKWPMPTVNGMSIAEVSPPSYETDFKKAMEARDAWAAYAAYREAARHRSTEVLIPTIKLFGELGDPTGMAFEALVAREEGREAQRLDLQRRAARAGDAMAKILVLESERGEHRVDDLALKDLSPEARAYSDALFSEGELTETIMRCYFIPSYGKEVADARCTKFEAEALKVTALSEVRWGTLWIFVSKDDSIPMPLTPSVAYMAFADPNPAQSDAMIRKLPSAGNARGVWHRSAGWPGEVKHVPAVAQLLKDLRLGASLEDPESGVLLHEASFTPPYRDAVTQVEALAGLQMAANWGHPAAMKRLSSLYEQGVGGVEANPTLALALLVGRDRYKGASDPDALEDANRIAATLTPKQIEMATFSAQTWRPGGLMVLFDPEKWDQPE